MAKILIVDDEMGIRELLCEILQDENHDVVTAANAVAARAIYVQGDLDLVLLDIWMPDIDGMTLLREWVGASPLSCPVVMMSGHASIDTALEANALGASGFLEKPITLQRLLSTVQKLLHRSSPVATATSHHSAVPSSPHLHGLNTVVRGVSREAAISSGQTPLETSQLNTLAAQLSPWQLATTQLPFGSPLREFREASDRIYFEHLLDQTHYSITRVSELSGLERTHLYRKFKQLGIDAKRKVKP